MKNKKEVSDRIDYLRKKMVKIMVEKDNLQDKELLEVSQLLDAALNEYEALKDEEE